MIAHSESPASARLGHSPGSAARAEALLALRFGQWEAALFGASPDLEALATWTTDSEGRMRGKVGPESELRPRVRTMAAASGPDPCLLVAFGHVDRALVRLEVQHRAALQAAYGDHGSAVTHDGLRPGQRWRAVAPLTDTAARLGRQWRTLHPDGHGDPAYAWWQRVTASVAPLDRRRVDAVRAEASALLVAAFDAFLFALAGLEAGQREIEIAGLRRLAA